MLGKQIPWHAWEPQKVLKTLETKETGLTKKEAIQRSQQYGLNQLPQPKRQRAILRFLRQFNNVLIYILLGSALITALLAHWIDTSVILAVVIINAIIGYIQEGKAEKALESIRNLIALKANVVRSGKRHTIPAEKLVPGDIVLLKAGDKVSADLRLLRVNSLQIQEAILTGESNPAEKSAAVVPEKSNLHARHSMAYSGTLVTYGQATAVVVATGMETEIGRISKMLATAPVFTTPLLQQMQVFARWLTIVILAITVLSILFGVYFWDYTFQEMFMAGVGLAVAAIPEALPPIMTITLALGVTRMARENAIIRRLPAVEAMGSVTVICTDKTGTLTKNELTVNELVTAEDSYNSTGLGYIPEGEIQSKNQIIDKEEHLPLKHLMHAAMLCNEAELLLGDDNTWQLHGNPVDGALLVLARKAKFDPQLEKRLTPRTDLIPFAAEYKYMASLHHDHEGNGFIFVKGAPEKILNICRYQEDKAGDQPIDPNYWEQQIQQLTHKGLRVIAVAMKKVSSKKLSLKFQDIEQDFVFLGLFGLIDLPRENVAHAVNQCKSAGISVKMITGDHKLTAKAVAEEVDIETGTGLLTGDNIDALTDAELALAANRVNVFARTTPEHKLRLVHALKSQGHVVAMTGDGVNDAPALKHADIGVAMGRKGTEAAKEAAEVVLADDNFVSIANAVKEGRIIYDNLKKTILYILPTNGGEAIVILLAVILGQMMPITPVQILWVNMITSVTLGLALAFEPGEKDVMQYAPRAPDEPILSRLLVWRIVFVSLLLVVMVFGLFYYYEHALPTNIAVARTVAVNMLVFGEIAYLFNCRSIYRNTWHRQGIIGNRAALIAIVIVLLFQLCFTYFPFMQYFFGAAAISVQQWLIITFLSVCLYFFVEFEKRFLSKKNR